VFPLLAAVVLSVGLFLLALSVSSFVLRDVHFVDPPPRAFRQPPPDPATLTGPARPLGPEGLSSAKTAVAPLVPECIAQARKKDPSVPTSIVLRVELVASAGTGEVRSLRVVRGASPYLQHCFNERAVGARFPVDTPGETVVRWRGTVVDGEGVLETAD
jgi:hypothetical protein